MKNLTFFAVAFVAILGAAPAQARNIDLVAETACELIYTQGKRLDAAGKVSWSAYLMSQGQETPASKSAGEQAAKDLIQWTTAGKCHPVTGKFKVLESRPMDGGRALKIREPTGNTVWVLQP